MGLLINKYVHKDVLLGLWDITEDQDYLFSSVKLDNNDLFILDGFKNESRKLEWLSVRKLLAILTKNDEVKIIYNEERKPFLSDNSFNISISHSHNFTSIMLSKTKKVGIDLEYMSHRIAKIENKFINESEVITSHPDLKKYHLYIHWCAKEALYKICDKHDINFKENIIINPFHPSVKGLIKGTVTNPLIQQEFELQYFRLQNYIIVWTCN